MIPRRGTLEALGAAGVLVASGFGRLGRSGLRAVPHVTLYVGWALLTWALVGTSKRGWAASAGAFCWLHLLAGAVSHYLRAKHPPDRQAADR